MKISSPTSIVANRSTSKLTVVWKDGHTSQYNFMLLRAGCPCAQCRGGHENMRTEPDPNVFSIKLPDSPTTRLIKAEPVGSYAITFEWEDGHHYGIYNWHYLRSLCPCQFCREVLQDDR